MGNETENTAYATAKSNTSSMTTKSSLKRKSKTSVRILQLNPTECIQVTRVSPQSRRQIKENCGVAQEFNWIITQKSNLQPLSFALGKQLTVYKLDVQLA